ncbi:MAG: hypothetical protein ABIK65_01345 [Candidatus Eisenbacteria bacterium]
MRERIMTAAVMAALAAIALSDRAGIPVPAGARALAALGLVTVVPGWSLARRLLPAGGTALRVPLAFALSQGALALLVILFFYARLPLPALLVPLSALPLVVAGRSGPNVPREGGGRGTVVLLVAAAVLVSLVSSPRAGFRADTYDHVGTVRRMIDRGHVFPGEYFHKDREGELDPRKGTGHTAFALASAVAGTDPTAAYAPLRLFQTAVMIFAFHGLARAVLGSPGAAWTAVVLLLAFFRGGFSNEWFHTAGYPGKGGVALYFVAASLLVDGVRKGGADRSRWGATALAAAGAAGVHAFGGILCLLGGGAFLAGCLIHPPLRPRAGAAGFLFAALLVGILPLALFRAAETYGPANPLHLHRQGALLLPGGLSVIDPVTLLRAAGFGGLFPFLLLPFIASPERGFGAGETFLIAASVLVLFVLANPLVFPLAESGGGYLTRRLPLLAPGSLVIAAALRRGCASPRRLRTALPAAAAGAFTLVALFSSVSRAEARRTLPGAAEAETRSWTEAAREVAKILPAEATVLADPVTAYHLFGEGRSFVTCVIDQHSSPNDAAAARRIADTQRFLRGGMPDGAADALLEHHRVDYVLVNDLFPGDFRTWNASIHVASFRRALRGLERRPDRFAPLSAPPGLHLFRVVGGPAPTETEPPHLEPSAGGPALAAPMPGGARLVAGRVEEERVAPGGKFWFDTTWEMTLPEADGVPMALFVRARLVGEGGKESVSLRRDPAKRTWGTYPLGDLDYPYILWREGDRVTDRHRSRVPGECPPGAYRIEVIADPQRFFQVRRLAGLERGAIRSGWTVIDTLEVAP